MLLSDLEGIRCAILLGVKTKTPIEECDNIIYYKNNVYALRYKDDKCNVSVENIEDITYNVESFAMMDIYKPARNIYHELERMIREYWQNKYIEDKKSQNTKNVKTNTGLEIKVRYHFDQCEHDKKIDFRKDGDWIDLRCAKKEIMKKGEYRRIELGVSIELPKGYYAMIAPRSSTFEKLNLYAPNGISVIDNTYCGDDDIWHFLCCASNDTIIVPGARICQFSIFKAMDPKTVHITEVKELNNPSRGGLGHSGIV